MTDGVLMMAHGTPDSLDEIPEYLRHVIVRRPPTPEFVEEIRDRYRRIGGRSPLTDLTRRQAAALQARLGLPVIVGMRHWKPFIAEAMKAASVSRLAGLPMVPHYSPLGVDPYHAAARRAVAAGTSYLPVPGWHREPAFLDAWASRLPIGPHLLFTAHSIPVEGSGSYAAQVRETIDGILERRPGLKWSLGWQSRSPSPVPWLEPGVEAVLTRLAGEGVRDVAFVPIGFVADHVEVLYDLDVLHAGQAAKLGMKASRVPSLNDHPGLIEALAAAVRRALA